MHIEHQKSLQSYNTFGINVAASAFIAITSDKMLIEVLKSHQNQSLFILSGGSNMLLTQDIDALVLHIAIKGITIIKDTDTTVLVQANAGENWHDFVQFCIQKGYGGLENLSLIPGCVGSAPIQNIGAYGVELKDTFVSCEAVHIKTRKKKIFDNKTCNFGYRNSIFKHTEKGEYIITQVTFRVTTKNHNLNTQYGAIEEELFLKQITTPTPQDIANAVINIRKSKLPDPKVLGNSGSFFKNPLLPKSKFLSIQQQHPNIKFYTVDENTVKVPAGWLIEQCGFKGKRWGDAGVHKQQALVLVNYGNASGQELLILSQKIKDTVKTTFDIELEVEVNIF